MGVKNKKILKKTKDFINRQKTIMKTSPAKVQLDFSAILGEV